MAIELQCHAGYVHGIPLSKLDCPIETVALCMIDGTCRLVGTTLVTRLLLVWFPRFNRRETSEMFREGIKGTGSRMHPPLVRDCLVFQEWGGTLYNQITGSPDGTHIITADATRTTDQWPLRSQITAAGAALPSTRGPPGARVLIWGLYSSQVGHGAMEGWMPFSHRQ